jgi:hypothetical protein
VCCHVASAVVMRLRFGVVEVEDSTEGKLCLSGTSEAVSIVAVMEDSRSLGVRLRKESIASKQRASLLSTSFVMKCRATRRRG